MPGSSRPRRVSKAVLLSWLLQESRQRSEIVESEYESDRGICYSTVAELGMQVTLEKRRCEGMFACGGWGRG